MPNDTKLVPDVAIEDWINRFNRAKGWERLKRHVPTPEKVKRGGENDKFRSEASGYFEHRIEGIGSKDEITNGLEATRKELARLEDAHKTAVGQEKLDLAKKIEEAREEIEDGESNLKLLEKLDVAMKQAKAVEKDVPKDLQDVYQRLETLHKDRGKTEKKFVPPKRGEVGYDEAQAFIVRHDNVAQMIENSRQEVMSVTTVENDIPVVRNYAVINSDEYRILFGMLEEARLTFEVTGTAEAVKLVEAAHVKLSGYRKARTGMVELNKVESFNELDAPFDSTRRSMDALRQGGFLVAATALGKRLEGLLPEARKIPPLPEVVTTAINLAGDGERMLVQMSEVQNLLREAGQNLNGIRSNEDEDRAETVDSALKGFIKGEDLALAVTRAREIRDLSKKLLTEARDERIKARNLKPEEVQKDLERAEKRFDKLFKHKSDGTVKMIKDTKTGKLKGDKKNSDLPRETLDELDLRIKSAQLLVKSDSGDSQLIAATYVGNVNIFLDNIERNPSWYADFAGWLKDLTSEYNSAEKDYRDYEVAKRYDIKADMDKLAKDYLTKPQAKSADKLEDLRTALKDYKKLCAGLQKKKNKTLIPLADAIGKRLDNIGEVLSEKKNKLGVTGTGVSEDERSFTGYHGRWRDDLAELRMKIDRRTEASLTEAEDDLIKLSATVATALESLKRYAEMERTNKGSVSSEDFNVSRMLLRDAEQGQKAAYADEKAKPGFELAIKGLERDAKTVESALKKVKGDMSDLEALKEEIGSLEKEAKAQGNYVSALERLTPLSQRMEKLLRGASGAAAIVDATLPEGARIVVTHMRTLKKAAEEFFDKVIRPVATDEHGANLFDTNVLDAKKVKDFCTSVAEAISAKALDELESAVKVVADGGKPVGERKTARKTALAAVRSLAAVLDGYKPTAHFRLHPFSDSAAITALNAARQGLPRIEIKILTAIDA